MGHLLVSYPKLCKLHSFLIVTHAYCSQVVAYNGATTGSKFRDMEAVDVKFQMGIGCIRVVFLNKFVMNLLVS